MFNPFLKLQLWKPDQEGKGVGIVYCRGGFREHTDKKQRDRSKYYAYLTRQGYTVLEVDYVVERLDMSSDIEATMFQINRLIGQGMKIYLLGVSRGGLVAYLTVAAWLSSFKSGIDGFIVCAALTNIDTWKPVVPFPKPFQDYFESCQSPIQFCSILDKIPSLLIYGKQDKITPISQGLEMQTKLTNSTFVALDEDHDVGDSPEAKEVILKWLSEAVKKSNYK